MKHPDPNNASRTTVLLLGNYRPAVAIARALSASGHRVMLGMEGEIVGADSSKHVAELWEHPHLTKDPSAFLVALLDLLDKRSDICAVFPVAENFVQFLSVHERAIRARVPLASPRTELVEVFLDKLEALQFAQSCDVATLPFEKISDFESLLGAIERIGFPLTIRPYGTSMRLGNKKALILDNWSHFHQAFTCWPEHHKHLLLQRYAPGQRHNIYFAARNGQFLGLIESKIFRTDHPDGTGLAVDGMTIPPTQTLVSDTQKLIEKTNYTGVGLAQFIVDPETGLHCFLELNPRVGGSHSVAEQSGLPLSILALELARDIQDPPAPDQNSEFGAHTNFKLRTNLRYAWSGGDLFAIKLALIHHEISYAGAFIWGLRAIRSAWLADIHMVWSWQDPRPALMSLFYLLPRKLRFNFAPEKIAGTREDRRQGEANAG